MSDWWKHGRGRQRGLDAVRDARDAPCAGARTHDGTGDDGPVLELDGDRLMAELLEEPDELHLRASSLPVRYFSPAVTDYPFGSTRAAVCVRSRWRASSRRTIRACPRGVVRVRSRSRRGADVRLTRVLRLAFEAFRRVFTVSVPRLTGWLAPTTHRHSQVTCVSPRLFPPRSHNEEHEGTRGGSVRAFGASRVER
jgi:hypothetical protein